MMHHDGTIVTIRTLPTGNVVREYRHSRTGSQSQATVLLDYDTEFAINFKFTDSIRRRLELWIDGAQVTDSLILTGSLQLERFVESTKKFKFVQPDHKDVADPANQQRSQVRFKPTSLDEYTFPVPDLNLSTKSYASPRYAPPREMIFTCQCSSSVSDCLRSVAHNDALGDAGAVVEGSTSKQKFSDTIWNGDEGEPLEFVFQLRGKNKSVKTLGTCKTCGQQNSGTAKFCSECGTSLR
jgi:hypothetical protein